MIKYSKETIKSLAKKVGYDLQQERNVICLTKDGVTIRKIGSVKAYNFLYGQKKKLTVIK